MASDTSTPPDPPRDGSARREPPVIDLASSEFSSETAADDTPPQAKPVWRARLDMLLDDTARPYLAAILCGLLAALSAVLLFWGSGLFGETQATITRLNEVQQRTSELSSQVNRVEAAAKTNPSAAPLAALTSRVDAQEKTIAALRTDVAEARRQTEVIAAQLKDLSATARSSGATDPQVLERVARLEGAVQGPATAAAEPAPNAGLQRLMVATTLDTAVRRNEPFASALAAARKAADNPGMLSALDAFADKGVPSDTACLRDLRDVLAGLMPAKTSAASPAAQPQAGTGDGWLDRLQASLSRAVRIERDTTPAPAPAVSAALDTALRNGDLAATRRELVTSAYASHPQVQAWLQRLQARDTALAATRQFQADALAAVTRTQ